MPITMLDPKTALIVIDLQNGIAGYPCVHPLPDIAARSRTLAAAFRARHMPVVMVTVNGVPANRTEQQRGLRELPQGWDELLPELDAQPQDHRVAKQNWGAFTNTGLQSYLKAQGVTQVVITGVATSAGVDSTARQANELGFNVVLVTDAMTDLSLEAHDYTIKRIFPRIGETGTMQDVLDMLTARKAA
ncbi:MAG: cysteine hydrolase [Micavibrio sp.]|nr:cysteine hydrolase [Micavibrio sp.]